MIAAQGRLDIHISDCYVRCFPSAELQVRRGTASAKTAPLTRATHSYYPHRSSPAATCRCLRHVKRYKMMDTAFLAATVSLYGLKYRQYLVVDVTYDGGFDDERPAVPVQRKE